MRRKRVYVCDIDPAGNPYIIKKGIASRIGISVSSGKGFKEKKPLPCNCYVLEVVYYDCSCTLRVMGSRPGGCVGLGPALIG